MGVEYFQERAKKKWDLKKIKGEILEEEKTEEIVEEEIKNSTEEVNSVEESIEEESVEESVEEKEQPLEEALKKFKKAKDLGPSLSVIGYGFNPNGNHVVRVELPGGKKKSIQTGQALPIAGKELRGKPSDVEKEANWDKIKKEIEDYIKKYESVEKEDALEEGSYDNDMASIVIVGANSERDDKKAMEILARNAMKVHTTPDGKRIYTYKDGSRAMFTYDNYGRRIGAIDRDPKYNVRMGKWREEKEEKIMDRKEFMESNISAKEWLTGSKVEEVEESSEKKQKKIELTEAKGRNEWTAVLMNGMNSETINFTDYKDFEKKYKDVVKKFKDATGSDDVWIDQIWVDRGPLSKLKIRWEDILLSGGKGGLNKDTLEMIMEDEDAGIKIAFLNDYGYDIESDRLEETQVWDASGDRPVDGNHGAVYPDGWVDDQVETFYSQAYSALEKINAEGYMDWARLLSDEEVNGGFTSGWVGNYFVWMMGN